MSFRSVAKLGLIVALIAPLSLSLSACGSSGQEAKQASVKPGEMPVGGVWNGVYYSPVYGYLHLITDGDSATGAWRNSAGDRWGELHGKIDGNLLKFQWTEHIIGLVGEGADRKGKGYFVYVAPKEGEAHELRGEYGLGTDEVGDKWDAIKQENMQPNPKSVRPDEIEGRVGGGGWDEKEGEGSSEGSGDDIGIEPSEPSEPSE